MILIPGSLMKLEKGTGEFLKDWLLLELTHIAFFFFFTFFESYGCNLLSVITPKTISYGSPRK